MKIGIITPNYRRAKIFELWAASIERIRRDLKIELPAVCVSDINDNKTCSEHNIHHIIMPNRPVTNKFNAGMEYMGSLVMDYVIISGSDDIFSSDTIAKIIVEAEKGYDMIGLSTLYFYAADGIHKGKLCKLNYTNRALGVGKTISRRVLNQINWKPWTRERNWGMDVLVTMAIRQYVKTQKLLDDVFVVDVKSRENINKSTMWFNKLKNNMIDSVEFYNILGEEEKQILKTL